MVYYPKQGGGLKNILASSDAQDLAKTLLSFIVLQGVVKVFDTKGKEDE